MANLSNRGNKKITNEIIMDLIDISDTEKSSVISVVK